jgi:multicomponent K+:H+ antiporter subunit E
VTKLVPAPLLSVALFAIWMLLARSTSAGQIVVALVLAIVVPIVTANLHTKVRVRRPLVVVRFILRVGADVISSNLAVACGVITWRWRRPNTKFVIIPLELRDPVGLAALSMVTTVVPGTVWSELAGDRNALLLHVWNVDSEDDVFIARFKARYEQPLREIFE